MSNERQIEPTILDRGKTDESFIYSEPLIGDFAREVYDEVRERAKKDYGDSAAFSSHFSFNEKTGEIIGSSTFWNTLIDMVLRKNGLWIPTLAQARMLQGKGRLPSNVYMDFGVVLYTEGDPNSNLAVKLAQDGNRRGLELPFVLPFSALNLKKANNKYHGVELVLSDNLQDVLSGRKAIDAINGLDYKFNSGLCGLDRGKGGGWCGDWNGDLAGSNSSGRVVRVCGEATRENLTEKLAKAVNINYDSRIAELQKERAEDIKGIKLYFQL